MASNTETIPSKCPTCHLDIDERNPFIGGGQGFCLACVPPEHYDMIPDGFDAPDNDYDDDLVGYQGNDFDDADPDGSDDADVINKNTERVD